MVKISAVVITFNEENNIRDCLASLTWADEIIVVDSFSTDNTLAICREFTDKIYQNKWPGNIGQWRYAVTLTRNNWVLSLDADERVSEKLRDEILGLNLEGSGADCYLIPRRAFFMGRWMNHSSWYPSRIPRLYDKTKGEWGGIRPHGVFVTRGIKAKLRGDILHIIGRNIVDFSISTLRYHDVSAEAYYEMGRRFTWHQITVRPFYTFIHKYFLRLGILDGIPGLAYSVLSAYGVFIKYLRLRDYEKQVVLQPLPQQKRL